MKRALFVVFSLIFVSTAHAETNTLSGLIAGGQSVECSFTNADGTQGTMYTANGKLRSEISSAQGPMHMIGRDQKMYMWGESMGGRGMIMSAQPGASSMGPMGQQGPDMNAQMEFSCKPWPADESQFEPPADVQFQDMNAMLNQLAAAQAGAYSN